MHPEFRQKARVRASYLGPGSVLISVLDESPASPTEESDPLVDAFLAFLANDISTHPDRVKGLSKRLVSKGSRLAKSVVVNDSDVIPDDITI